MSKPAILDGLKDSIVNFDSEGVSALAENALGAGISAYEAIMSGMAEGMKIVGEKYQRGEFYLADLLLATDTFNEGMKVLSPHLRSLERPPQARVVIGTVEGDLHDIGKNLVKYMLEAAGFEVHDLGVDVTAAQFVNKAREHSVPIVAMSALISTTFPHMREAVNSIRKSGITARIIVGGATLNTAAAKALGADGFGKDAVEGANLCKNWSTEMTGTVT